MRSERGCQGNDDGCFYIRRIILREARLGRPENSTSFLLTMVTLKTNRPASTVPRLQVHLKIFVYKYMTPGMWSATAHSGMFDFSIPVADEYDAECSYHPE